MRIEEPEPDRPLWRFLNLLLTQLFHCLGVASTDRDDSASQSIASPHFPNRCSNNRAFFPRALPSSVCYRAMPMCPAPLPDTIRSRPQQWPVGHRVWKEMAFDAQGLRRTNRWYKRVGDRDFAGGSIPFLYRDPVLCGQCNTVLFLKCCWGLYLPSPLSTPSKYDSAFHWMPCA